ncbi:MAG: hypothetical protein LBS30_01785 [Planctomycetota bacterium]|nr:hypothetical protein [Planctomycetota bacterium]
MIFWLSGSARALPESFLNQKTILTLPAISRQADESPPPPDESSPPEPSPSPSLRCPLSHPRGADRIRCSSKSTPEQPSATSGTCG